MLVYELENVCFSYREQQAIDDLSLTIEQGERIALLGPNGSGKSSLLRILAGLSFAQQGRVQAFGQGLDEATLSRAENNYAFRQRVGMVFQNADVQLFNATVLDEVAFGPLQLGWDNEQVLSRVDDMLIRFGIDKLKERAPYRLSGGEKKRLALASVLVMEPEVLLLDEPLAALDPSSQDRMLAFLAEQKGSGRTLIIATHDRDNLPSIADRTIVLERGRLVADDRI